MSQWILKTNGLPAGYSWSAGVAAYGDKTALVGLNLWFDNYIYKTTNGGDNWFELPWFRNEWIESISILDSDKIWVATTPGRIYSTTNGGYTWNLQNSDTTKTIFMNYIKMFDENNGIAMGDAPANDKPLLILKTTNGGLNWISMNDSFFIGGFSRSIWNTISFASPTTGYLYPSFSGQSQDKLFKTTDGGRTWSPCPISFPPIWKVKFYNDNIGIVLTYHFFYDPPKLHRTTNGGNTWETFNLPTIDTNALPRDIEFVPGYPNKVWFTDNWKLFFSDNMGETWNEQFVDISRLLSNSIVFGDSLNGWLFCSEGKIYKTSNGDRIILAENEQSIKPTSYMLFQNYPNPFNNSTIINYHLPAGQAGLANNGSVSLKVYNILGSEVATLVDEVQDAGFKSVEFKTDKLSSGVYYYRLMVSPLEPGRGKIFHSVKKMLLTK